MNKLFVTLSLVIAASHAEAAPPRVVTTTTDLMSIVEAVKGSLPLAVESLSRGNQDPHYVQARPTYMTTLSRADLLISVGLELEVGWLPTLIEGARNPEINPGKRGYLEASSVIKPIDVPSGPVDRSRGDLHPYGNPHFWLDPENVKTVSKAIADRLAELDPENAATYEKNQETFAAKLDAGLARWTKALEPFKGTKISSYHKTYDYFHRRFGLVPIVYVEEKPGIPPSPSHVANVIRTMKREKVTVVFHENFYDQATSELVANKAGAKLLVLPTSVGGVPEAKDYPSLIDHIVGRVSSQLSAPAK